MCVPKTRGSERENRPTAGRQSRRDQRRQSRDNGPAGPEAGHRWRPISAKFGNVWEDPESWAFRGRAKPRKLRRRVSMPVSYRTSQKPRLIPNIRKYCIFLVPRPARKYTPIGCVKPSKTGNICMPASNLPKQRLGAPKTGNLKDNHNQKHIRCLIALDPYVVTVQAQCTGTAATKVAYSGIAADRERKSGKLFRGRAGWALRDQRHRRGGTIPCRRRIRRVRQSLGHFGNHRRPGRPRAETSRLPSARRKNPSGPRRAATHLALFADLAWHSKAISLAVIATSVVGVVCTQRHDYKIAA